ncbi:MAG: response regulator with CheY-like receiver, AAA-type ATPase, and DNA-binding domain [Bacteroidetes bacterium]|nr:MAG: response regulator with CheY-like receiver, AAA-type ATPase, and DNA-binding domain [Bacteroidota bacterium]
MGFRITIGRRIILGFSVLIFLTLLAFGLTLITLRQSREINEKITNLYTPSVDALEEMNLLVVRSKMLVTNWVNTQAFSEDKPKLKKLIQTEYPELKRRVLALSKEWSTDNIEDVNSIFSLSEKLWEKHNEVMNLLNTFESYEEASVIFSVRLMVLDEDADIPQQTRVILDQLSKLIESQHKAATAKSTEMLESFQQLQLVVIALGIALPIGGILIALLTARTIVRPIGQLKKILQQMSRGVLKEDTIRNRNDEIGEMSVALGSLVSAMRMTTEFANEVGSGNFDSYYKPLSEDDTLGYTLLKMRDDLRENERELEAKVIERTEEVVRQKEEIEIQNQKLEVLYKHVTDSIRYAKRLQEAVLPPPSIVKGLMPESFILYKPKDIVSGDFYWLHQKDGKVLVAAVDCTGHGVPGAFMSILGNNMLAQIMRETPLTNAAAILDTLNELAGKTINQNSDEGAVRDGMDMSLCIFDPATRQLDYAGANNPLYIFRGKQFTEVKADKIPIGYIEDSESKKFTNHRIQLEAGDTVYIFSDGYADQFGGPKGKKFMVNQFRNMLGQIYNKPMEDQKKQLDETIESWRGGLEQVDDILVIGFRVS